MGLKPACRSHLGVHDDQLVTTEASQLLAGDQCATEALGHRDQQTIAQRVSVRVVVRVELVDVAEQQRDRSTAVRWEGGERTIDDIEQEPPVGQAGEGVMRGLVGQARLAPLPFGDVDELAEHPRLAVPRPHDRDRQTDPDDLAVRPDVALVHVVARDLTAEQAALQLQVRGHLVGMGH